VPVTGLTNLGIGAALPFQDCTSNTPPQLTRCTAALARHWVPNYNNGQLAVDVEGDSCGTGACALSLRRSCTDHLCDCCFFKFVVPSSCPSPLLWDPCPPVCSTSLVFASRAIFDTAAWGPTFGQLANGPPMASACVTLACTVCRICGACVLPPLCGSSSWADTRVASLGRVEMSGDVGMDLDL
jgi:hypothetical protein